ncbi:MAG: sulfatase-like hydrolase/transferase, partial [Candidatus Hodarchaeota archaeon]
MRNLVVLLCDALRYDVVKESFMPEITKLSKEAFVYTDAHVCETCTELSMPYLLCGEQKYDVDKSIATYLSHHGYFTSLLTTNFFVFEKFNGGWMQKQYYPSIQPRSNLSRTLNKVREKFAIFCMKNLPEWIESIKMTYTTGKGGSSLPYMPSNKLLAIAENGIYHQPKPWFTWIHLMDTHTPYYPYTRNYSKAQLVKLNIRLDRYAINNNI